MSKTKQCLFCKKDFPVGGGKVGEKRKFCSKNCYFSSDCFMKTDELNRRIKNRQKYGSENPNWRGGKARCTVCNKELSQRNYKNCFEHRNIINWPRGDKHYMWKGGITPIRKKIERSREYIDWRTAVFLRDSYTCVMCGATNGNGKKITLNADHILPFSLYPELRLDVNNGRTLCVSCHKKTETFGIKSARSTLNYA